MAAIMAASCRAARPTVWQMSRMHFGTVIPKGEVEHMISGAATHAQSQYKAHTQSVVQCEMAAIKHRFDEAAEHHAELQSQLLAQSQASSRYAEQLAQSLQAASVERAHLRNQVDKLYTDMHAVTAQMLKEQVGVRERVQREGIQGRGGQSRTAYRPTLEDAERQPTHVSEMSHQTLAELSMMGNHCAQRERMIREIMAVDGVPWEEAHHMLNRLDEYNEKYYWIESMPYRIGITCAFIGGVMGTFMVFCPPVALWYGENVAGEDLPEGMRDISEMTINQVGTWTWSWMEPMIGVASFALLCCQFSRSQIKKINMKTFGEHLLGWRADRLARRFPEYDSSMVRAWAKHMPRVNMNFFPVFEKFEGLKGPTSGL